MNKTPFGGTRKASRNKTNQTREVTSEETHWKQNLSKEREVTGYKTRYKT